MNPVGLGAGLSTVTDMSAMYHGAVTLGDASLGGLRIQLKLPAAQ